MPPRTSVRFAAVAGVAFAFAACSTVLGLGNYGVRSTRDGGSDAEPDVASGPAPDVLESTVGDVADANDATTTCDVDPATRCYPCAPDAQIEFLNACTSATCVPFDDSTRLTHLLSDGGLPPLPPLADSGATE